MLEIALTTLIGVYVKISKYVYPTDCSIMHIITISSTRECQESIGASKVPPHTLYCIKNKGSRQFIK